MRFDFQYRYLDLYFTTATIKGWKHLLKPDKYKQIITDSFEFLVKEKSVSVYGFVIMPNHFHWIWQMQGTTTLSHVQLRLMKFVAQHIKFDLIAHHPAVLEHFKVRRNDRQYQFFKEKPLSIALYRDEIVWQKLEYIHWNPVQPTWRLVRSPEEYLYSSAAFYTGQADSWPFLTHFWYGEDWGGKHLDVR